MLIILLACVLGPLVAALVPEECPSIISEAGLSPTFAHMVTHSIHSLTVEDIRYYFKPDATEDNGIPTVNVDARSNERVLLNAPLAGYDDDFTTKSLKSFDLVMRNMNRTWWGIQNYSTLEKVAHALHMAEAWENAMREYKVIEKQLDPESDLCTCVTDIKNNGVLNYLNLVAFNIRYPGITSGNDDALRYYLAQSNSTDSTTEDTHVREKRVVSPGHPANFVQVDFSIYKRSLNFDGIDFELSDVELLKDVAEKFAEKFAEEFVDEATTVHNHLDSADNWESWKNMLKLPKEESEYYDIAVFMFCMLN